MENPKQILTRNTLGIILIFIGLGMGLSFFGWLFTLNNMCIVIGVIGIIIFITGFFLIK